MKAEKILGGAALSLALLFAAQFGLAHRNGPPLEARYAASWANNPHSMEELMGLSEEVVLGRVTGVRRGEDFVTRAEGEEEGVDRIPVEVVTIQVEKDYKGGGRAETIELFHTGISKGSQPSARDRPPGPPPDGAQRPQSQPDLSPAATRTVILSDDPPYERGERYVLMLRGGPEVAVGGRKMRTQRVVSPEGRYRVTGQGQIQPVSSRADFARQMRGRSLEQMEERVQRAQERAQEKRPPWAGRGGD